MYDIQFIATTSADWAQSVEMVDANTNLPLDLPDDAVFELSVGDHCWNGDFRASTTDGTITRPTDNVIQWRFTPNDLHRFNPRISCPVGLTVTTDGGTTQLLVGTLSIIDGVVR